MCQWRVFFILASSKLTAVNILFRIRLHFQNISAPPAPQSLLKELARHHCGYCSKCCGAALNCRNRSFRVVFLVLNTIMLLSRVAGAGVLGGAGAGNVKKWAAPATLLLRQMTKTFLAERLSWKAIPVLIPDTSLVEVMSKLLVQYCCRIPVLFPYLPEMRRVSWAWGIPRTGSAPLLSPSSPATPLFRWVRIG